ncbi:MAG: single-stranded-DNA-specific exonuclease RecJ [Planctomycetales bacterium]|nr:single-stranded-DNA-specific exonuclease RecJ [Planctomycetales bacterium]
MKWKFKPYDPGAVQDLERSCQVSPLLAQLLWRRGIIEPDSIRRFLHAKLVDLRAPELLPGIDAAAQRILLAIEKQEQIVIYGDYDADGMTATAIMYRCLKHLNAQVSYHLPNRIDEGYGLHSEAMEKLAARGKQVVVTVDCGIASPGPARRAKELGLSLIVTDHHRYGDELPVAEALVHPALPGSDYPFPGLCGAGVAFKLAWALCQRHTGQAKVTKRLRDFLMEAVGLAAIGTVADVVPLIDENRVIVRNGLKTLKTHARDGLQSLMKLAKLDDKKELCAEDIAFSLAPRLNAAGRLGQAQLGVELLVTEDPQRASALADYLQELNENRNKLERSIHLSATKQLKEVHDIEADSGFVLASPNWHPGVIGIVAGKLAEKYHRPVVMIALDKLGIRPGIGSARSPNGVNLHLAIQQCQDLIISGGGHAAAAGLKIEEPNVGAFRAAFLDAVDIQSSVANHEAELEIEIEAALGQLDFALVAQMEKLSPFGQENPRPLFYASQVQFTDLKLLGASGKHMAMQVTQFGAQMRAVAFGNAEEWLPALGAINDPLDIVFRPVINEFRGYRNVELQLVDWKICDERARNYQRVDQAHSGKNELPTYQVPVASNALRRDA